MAYEVVSEMVTFPNDSSDVTGFLARPKADGKFPCVIVIQEWWGLVPHIKNVAERFAAEGYVAVAPDLYHGQSATEPDGAMQLARSLAWDSALHDLRATARNFSRLPYTTGKIGCVGFCMGGGLTYRFACHTNFLNAAAVFYGSSPNQIEEARSLSCPLLGLYGETDERITSQAPALVEELRKHDKYVETHVYPGAPHGFFNDDAPQIYREDAAKDAWQRTLAFFKKYLAY